MTTFTIDTDNNITAHAAAPAAARGGHDILPGPGSAPDTTAPAGTGAEPKDHTTLNPEYLAKGT